MKMNLYAIKDRKIGFSHPFPMLSDDVALRSFTAMALSPNQNEVNTYPEDKELWKVGMYDDETGDLLSESPYMIQRADVIQLKYKKDEKLENVEIPSYEESDDVI